MRVVRERQLASSKLSVESRVGRARRGVKSEQENRSVASLRLSSLHTVIFIAVHAHCLEQT